MDPEAEAEFVISQRRHEIEDACKREKIDLHASNLDDLDALTIAIKLTDREVPVKTIHLGSNSIGDEGFEAVSRSLSFCYHL